MSRRAVVDFLAMMALQGKMVALTEDVEAESVLQEFWNIGGITLPDKPAEIVKMALRYCEDGSRVSHIIVNTVGEDVHIGLVISTPDYPADEKTITAPDGILTYVYVPTTPWNSELGFCFYERKADKHIHRIG